MFGIRLLSASALLLSASSHAQDGQSAQPSVPTSAAAPAAQTSKPKEAVSFFEAFAPYSAIPASPPPRADGAVDLAAIDIPRELPPKPKPAASGKVKRSLGTGVASYYGARFAGRLTANGERFNPRHMTAAHKTLPFGSRVRVTNVANGRSVVVRINDRGPFIRGRTIDLSRAAAERIGLIKRGHGRVKLELLAR